MGANNKWCLVPKCKSSSWKTPKKQFINVPWNPQLRLKWLKLAGRDPDEVTADACVYFCEDHFDKDNPTDPVLPSKFTCQDTQDASIVACANIKEEKPEVVAECEEEYILGGTTGTSSQIDGNNPETCGPKYVEYKVQCCVPSCKATEHNEVTFHKFPSRPRLRAAWLRALGLRGARLRRGSAVCSRHFLRDDFCVDVSGVREIRPGAVPLSAVPLQLCLVCLDAGGKLRPLTQLNLEEAYTTLTGHPPLDLGNLQPLACVLCAQRLRDFTRLRETGLRARALLTELHQTHGVITMSHMELIQRERHKLASGLVTSPPVDRCDASAQAESGAGIVPVKTERDSVLADEDTGALLVEVEPYSVAIESEASATVAALAAGSQTAAPVHSIAAELRDAELCASGCCPLKNTFICDICQHVAKQKRSLRAHMKIHALTHGCAKVYSCKLCKYKTPYTTRFTSHLRTHTGEKPYSCELCEYKSAHKGDLIKHTKNHTDEKLFRCDLCDYRTAMRSSLAHHMTSKHTGEKRFSCEICDYKCIRKEYLKYHNAQYHSGVKPYKCQFCGYTCILKSRITDHIKTHTGEKPYSCNVCEFKSANKKRLKYHMKTHTDEKPYSCEVCEFKCAFKSYLAKHMRKHTGEKPYKCEYCEYTCARKYSLLVHTRTHTGERPYSCTVCDYTCAQRSVLVTHMKTHTGGKASC